jgi:hypothetical protein
VIRPMEHDLSGRALESRLSSAWHGISAQERWAFAACFVSGLLIHLYAFTNLIPNADGISRLYDAQQMTISGRWFLHYASALNGYFELPAMIGVLSLIFLSLAAALTVRLLRVRGSVWAALIGVSLTAFPPAAYTYLYMFTASAYFLGVLFAVLGVYFTARKKYGFLYGAVFLALAMGIYQTYAAVAIGLCLIVVMLDALEPGRKSRVSFMLGLRCIAFLLIGVALYLVILKIFLSVKDLELLSYQGISSTAGGYPAAQLPSIILKAYKGFAEYFFIGSVTSYTTAAVAGLHLLLALLSVFLFFRIARRGRAGAWNIVIALCMAILLPMGLNFSQVLAPSSTVTPIMKYPLVLAYVLPAVLLDRCADDSRATLRALRGAGLALLAVALFYCWQVDNIVYSASDTAMRATESFCNRLVSRIETTDGYEDGMEVLIIGSYPTDRYYSDIPAYDLVRHYSCDADSTIALNKQIYYFIDRWLNVPIAEPDEQDFIDMAASDEFKAMPRYPDDGCAKVVDGKLVVKLQETYTPKKDYEIQYENRR